MTITQRIYDSKTCKAIVRGLSILVMMTVPIGVAHADWTGQRNVDYVWQYNAGNGYVFLLGKPCPLGSNGYFVISRDGGEHETLMRMVTEAKVHNRVVEFGFSWDGSFCQVSSVRLF